MDLTAPVGIAAVIFTIATLLIILFQAIRIFWRVIPSWLKFALGSVLVIVLIILVATS